MAESNRESWAIVLIVLVAVLLLGFGREAHCRYIKHGEWAPDPTPLTGTCFTPGDGALELVPGG